MLIVNGAHRGGHGQLQPLTLNPTLTLALTRTRTRTRSLRRPCPGAGSEGHLVSISVEQFSTSVKILGGMHAGRVVEGIEYEDVCKLAPT